MSYLGRSVDAISNVEKLDNITFNGGTTYALTKSSAAFTPAGANNILISIDGVVQQGNFSVSGSNIVFTFSPTSSNTCDFIMHYGTGLISTPADGTVTKDKTNFVSTSSSSGLQIKGDGTTDGTLQLNCSQNSHGIKLKSPAHSTSSSYTLTFPGTDPAADKMLQTDGSGNLSFVDAPSGGLVLVGGSEGTSDVSEVNIDNCFTSTYKQYIVRVIIAPDANADIRFRFRTGGASGSTRTNSDHFWISEQVWRSESDGSQGESLASAHGDDKWKISYDTGYDSTAALTTATINFYDPYGSQFSRQYWNAISFWQYYTGGKNYGGHFHGKTQSNVTATGLNFSPASGNIYYHSIKVYGMVNS